MNEQVIIKNQIDALEQTTIEKINALSTKLSELEYKNRYHVHNGIDNIRVAQSNINVGTRVNGASITFSQQTRYLIGITFNPTMIQFNGIVVDSITAPTIRAQCVGIALLGGSYYLQPSTTTSVTTASTIQNITQSGSYLAVLPAGAARALVTQTHILSFEYGGIIYARMTIESYNNQGLVVNVETLATGYSIVGNFTIT